MRALITGFGPFPGAPFNPTQRLVHDLQRKRRPALANVERIAHVFTVAYNVVDAELPELLERHQPDVLLMFGLAARTPHLRVELRVRNAITTIWPDAAQTRIRHGKISIGGPDSMLFGSHTKHILRAATRTSMPSAASRDAGRYLCNYLCWRAIEAAQRSSEPPLSAFVHVPLVARTSGARPRGMKTDVTHAMLLEAGEAILLEMIRLARARQQPVKAGAYPVFPPSVGAAR